MLSEGDAKPQRSDDYLKFHEQLVLPIGSRGSTHADQTVGDDLLVAP